MTDENNIAFSIIIPTFNEAETLNHSLLDLFSKIEPADVEVIISDGNSSDNTLHIARRFPCRVIRGESGRAKQMNHASKQAKGEWIFKIKLRFSTIFRVIPRYALGAPIPPPPYFILIIRLGWV
ncbi:MAG: glycosyltransferase, partial [Gammaproteobacteria bacterium]|nr:glycosyltransferase [Gammaproteobacteria bacterium]